MTNSTISVVDAAGANQAIAKVPDTGRAAAALSLPVVFSTEDQTPFTVMNASLVAMNTVLVAINANTPVAYAAGAGAVGATVQRITFASDAPVLATSTGDGNSVTMGALADAAVAAGANGSISAKLRAISRDIVANIVIAAGENVVGKTVGIIVNPTASVTRPADTTAYAVGDLVANNTTAGSVTALTYTAATRVAAGSAQIRRVRLSKSTTSTTNAAFRAHFFSATPLAPTNGDNGAFVPVGATTYLGAFDVFSMLATTDGAVGVGLPVVGSEINFVLASGQTIFSLLEARAAYTPGNAEVFTLVPEILQN